MRGEGHCLACPRPRVCLETHKRGRETGAFWAQTRCQCSAFHTATTLDPWCADTQGSELSLCLAGHAPRAAPAGTLGSRDSLSRPGTGPQLKKQALFQDSATHQSQAQMARPKPSVPCVNYSPAEQDLEQGGTRAGRADGTGVLRCPGRAHVGWAAV